MRSSLIISFVLAGFALAGCARGEPTTISPAAEATVIQRVFATLTAAAPTSTALVANSPTIPEEITGQEVTKIITVTVVVTATPQEAQADFATPQAATEVPQVHDLCSYVGVATTTLEESLRVFRDTGEFSSSASEQRSAAGEVENLMKTLAKYAVPAGGEDLQLYTAGAMAAMVETLGSWSRGQPAASGVGVTFLSMWEAAEKEAKRIIQENGCDAAKDADGSTVSPSTATPVPTPTVTASTPTPEPSNPPASGPFSDVEQVYYDATRQSVLDIFGAAAQRQYPSEVDRLRNLIQQGRQIQPVGRFDRVHPLFLDVLDEAEALANAPTGSSVALTRKMQAFTRAMTATLP